MLPHHDLTDDDGSLRPLLKWAGGKRWLVPHLRELWRGHERRRLVEPFCGGLAATLGLRPTLALLNDANPSLINFYRHASSGAEFHLPPIESLAHYLEARRRFNELVLHQQEGSPEAAALFFVLNKTCYNGLCRFNKAGVFNVPFGKRTHTSPLLDSARFRELFQGWQFTVGDFEKLALQNDDFVYADPPYDVPFRHYSSGGFTWEDHLRLAEWLDGHKGPFVLSNQATPRVLRLYKRMRFRVRCYMAPRLISCNGNRTRVVEVVATRNVDDAKGMLRRERRSPLVRVPSRSSSDCACSGKSRRM